MQRLLCLLLCGTIGGPLTGCADAPDPKGVLDVRQALQLRLGLLAALEPDPAAGVGGPFFDQPCAVQTSVGFVRTYELDRCDGPHGLRAVSGTVTLTRDGDDVRVEADALKANGFTFTFETTLPAGSSDESDWTVVLPSGERLQNSLLVAVGSDELFAPDSAGCLGASNAGLLEWVFFRGGVRHTMVVASVGRSRCWGSCPDLEETLLDPALGADESVVMIIAGDRATWKLGDEEGGGLAPCGGNLEPPAPWSPN